jgi:hypothetical protein
VGNSVREAIGDRLGQWNIVIREEQPQNSWWINVAGPNNFDWTGSFSGHQKDPAFVRAKVEENLPPA